MNNLDSNYVAIDDGANRIFVDLIFDLAAGARYKPNCTYREQLEHYVEIIMGDNSKINDFILFGQKYRKSSEFMFPSMPDKIKKREILIKLFSSVAVLREYYECDSVIMAKDSSKMLEKIFSRYSIFGKKDSDYFMQETKIITRMYSELFDDEVLREYQKAMKDVVDDFYSTFSCVEEYVCVNSDSIRPGALTSESDSLKAGTFTELLQLYNIPESESTNFHLEVDAIAETVVIKNKALEYEEEFQCEWENRFPKYPYSEALEKYVKSKKAAFVVAYGNNINSIRNESFLFVMLADVTVKLALADGAKNVYELSTKIKELTKELGNNIKETFIDSRKNAIRIYHLAGKSDYPSNLRDVLIPYRSDLLYLRDIIIEEISFRNAENIVQKKTKVTKDVSEYELLISQKDAEIYDLRRELEYYENIRQQEFKAEVSQYNKALTDLFMKMCDYKYNSPLNKLYLLAIGDNDFSHENVKGILQNLFFILSTINITPYDIDNIGKTVRFSDDEANLVYSVDENKVKEGLNQGIQIYPGWKYKDTELVLPKVEVKEENQ